LIDLATPALSSTFRSPNSRFAGVAALLPAVAAADCTSGYSGPRTSGPNGLSISAFHFPFGCLRSTVVATKRLAWDSRSERESTAGQKQGNSIGFQYVSLDMA